MSSERILCQLEQFFDESRIPNCLQTYRVDSVFTAWIRHVEVGEEKDLFGLLSFLINFRDPDLEAFVESKGIRIENKDNDLLRMNKLLKALQIQAYVPTDRGLHAIQDELKNRVRQYKNLLERGKQRTTNLLRRNEGFFYWPECEMILRRVFVFYNAVIYQFLDISDNLRDDVERALEADSLGAMLRSMVELNNLMAVPDKDPQKVTEEQKRLNEDRRRLRQQFESTFGRTRFSGGITDEKLNTYTKMYDEYRNKPAHGKVAREVEFNWALTAMESLQEIVNELIQEGVYPGIKVPFAFEIDAWGREQIVFWEESNIGEKGLEFYEYAPYSIEPNLLYHPCMGCKLCESSDTGLLPPSASSEKEILVYGQSKWIFWTLDQLDAMRDQRIEHSDLKLAIQQADETISPEARDNHQAVLAEVESHLRDRFRKRVVDRLFNPKNNDQTIKAAQNKVLQLWEQIQKRRECLSRITELIYLIALRKAQNVSDHVVLKDLRELMRKACGNPGPCKRCQTRQVCHWVNSLAANVTLGE